MKAKKHMHESQEMINDTRREVARRVNEFLKYSGDFELAAACGALGTAAACRAVRTHQSGRMIDALFAIHSKNNLK